ncbi:8185_t:CDS:1, partial [Gigaspora rosea]
PADNRVGILEDALLLLSSKLPASIADNRVGILEDPEDLVGRCTWR